MFLEEKVDVAILEVGLGGRFDATNVVPRPIACGVASLGLEHTAILGHTIEEIAYHKGGIIKVCLLECMSCLTSQPSTPAFTVQQLPNAMEALLKCAHTAQVDHASRS